MATSTAEAALDSSAYADPVPAVPVGDGRTLMPVDGADLPSVRVGGGLGLGVHVATGPAVEAIPTPTALQGGLVVLVGATGYHFTRRRRAA